MTRVELNLSAIFTQVAVMFVVGFLSGSLGVYVTIKIMAHRIKMLEQGLAEFRGRHERDYKDAINWFRAELKEIAKGHEAAVHRIHGRIDTQDRALVQRFKAVDQSFTEHLTDHAHGKFKG